MKDNSVVGHGILAAAAVILAYAAWQAPASSGVKSEVEIVPGTEESLTQIHWQEEQNEVTIKRSGDAADDDVAVTVLKKPKELKEGEEAPKPQTYPGTKQAKELFGKLSPLKATRGLGVVEGEALTKLGLDEPKSKLTLHHGSVEHTVEVGNNTFGTGDLYVRAPDGKTYLLASTTVSKLRYGGSSLVDRNATGVDREKVERVVIRQGDKEREVVQRFSEDSDKAYFADPAEPDTKLKKVSAWVDRLLRLRVSKIGEGGAPTSTPAVTAELFGSDGTLGKISVWDPKGDKHATALSTRFPTPILVSKSNTKALLRDIDTVLQESK